VLLLVVFCFDISIKAQAAYDVSVIISSVLAEMMMMMMMMMYSVISNSKDQHGC